MDADLETFNAAWADKPNRAHAKDLATAYCGAHDVELRPKYGALTIPELVALVDLARANEDEETRTRIDVWLLVNHAPQQIGGTVNRKV